jgi:autotransporter-associated beta strand protein
MKNPFLSRSTLIIVVAAFFGTLGAHAATNIWTGATGTANQTWTNSANWSPAGPPGIFNGALYNNVGVTNAAGLAAINSIVSVSETNQFLIFNQSNGFHNVLINPGVTLTMSNNAAGNMFHVGTEFDLGAANQETTTISGAGGTLTFLNTNVGANLVIRQASATSGSHNATLDMSGLDTFNATLGRVLVAVQLNVIRPAGTLLLAKTNFVALNGSSPQLDLGDGGSNGGLGIMQLGQTNAIFVDNVTVGRSKSANGTTMIFNSAFTANNPVAYFRGLNRTNRIANWLIADNSSQSGIATACLASTDVSGGYFDAMVDTLSLARSQNGGGNGASTGSLTFGAGTLDVNTMEIGFQVVNTVAAVATGTVNVNGPGTLTVNTSLRLARYNAGGTAPAGTLNINGGTVKVFSDIVDGGGNSSLNLNAGILDMLPAGDTVPGNVAVRNMSVGSSGTAIITNAATITATNLTLAAGAVIRGNTTINVPSSSATMDVSGLGGFYTVGGTQTLEGFGSVSGDVTQAPGATLIPGVPAVAGTLTFNNNLTLNAGGNLPYDLSNDPSQVGGANDLIQVNGNLNLLGTNNVSLTALNGDFGNGSYRLFNYNGTLTGDATYFQIVGPVAQSRRQLSFDTSTANQVNLTVSGSAASTNLLWVGGLSGNAWDLKTTSNWNNNGSSDIFYNLDGVIFDDTGSASPSVALTGTLVPGSILVTNDANAYTFSGSGGIAGITGITKQGVNTLTIAGTGANTFSGPITIGGGTLAFNRNDDLTLANAISGNAGTTLAKQGTNTLTLSGVSGSFDGAVTVSSGTLKAGTPTVLGSTVGATTVATGATLDVNHNYMGLESVTVSGWGVNSNGAVINSGASVFPALTRVTLAGDTAFGGPGAQALGGSPQGRWDIRLTSSGPTDPAQSSLSTSNNAYNLFKVGMNYVGIVNVTVDPMLANVDIHNGTLSLQYNTTCIGNPTNTLTVRASADLDFFNSTNLWNKIFIINGDGVNTNLSTSSGANTMIGPVTLNGNCTINNSANTTLTLAGGVTGAGAVTKTGTGTLIVTSPTNSWSGGTTINLGTLQVGDGVSNGSLPAQPIIDNGVLSFTLGGGTMTFTNVISGNGSLLVAGAGTVLLTAANTFTNQVVINTSNSAALRINNSSALGDANGLTRIVGNTNGNGRLEVLGNVSSAEPFLLECRQDKSLDVPHILNISDNNAFSGTISGTTGGSDWNVQSDSGKLTISGNFNNTATSSTRLLKLIGAGNGEWSGVISNSPGNTSITAIVKTNSGTWILSGANQYTGNTTVNGGTLLINGSILSGATVNTGTLGGSGTINGNVSVGAAGTLSPGNSIGTITIFGTVTLAGTNLMELNKNGATLTSDLIQGVSHLTYGGVLKLQISGDPLAANDAFTIYSAGLRDGMFASLVPATPGPGLVWNTNTLASDGKLRVASGINTARTNITLLTVGNSLDLSWPQDHTGWRLQAQTSSVSVGLLSNWFDVPGSTTTNHMTIPISPTNGSVFYRMVYP